MSRPTATQRDMRAKYAHCLARGMSHAQAVDLVTIGRRPATVREFAKWAREQVTR